MSRVWGCAGCPLPLPPSTAVLEQMCTAYAPRLYFAKQETIFVQA
jgi:hypothetical protein